jgi:hypothetical protein
MADLPSPLVDLVGPLQWYELTEGTAVVLQNTLTITAAGTTQLPTLTGTFQSVYVDAPGDVTLLLPTTANLVAGQRWTVIDTSDNANNNPITLNGNGNLINTGNGTSATFTLNIPNGSVTLEWNGTAFSLVA